MQHANDKSQFSLPGVQVDNLWKLIAELWDGDELRRVRGVRGEAGEKEEERQEETQSQPTAQGNY